MSDKKKKFNDSNQATNYLDLLYMTPSVVNAKDIADFIKETNEITVDLWEEMNVLEIELRNHNTIDFEPVDMNFKDPSDAAFVKNRGIKTVFAISLEEDDLATVKAYFEKIINNFSGFLCSDSADFNPVYAGSAARLIN